MIEIEYYSTVGLVPSRNSIYLEPGPGRSGKVCRAAHTACYRVTCSAILSLLIKLLIPRTKLYFEREKSICCEAASPLSDSQVSK